MTIKEIKKLVDSVYDSVIKDKIKQDELYIFLRGLKREQGMLVSSLFALEYEKKCGYTIPIC